MNIRLYIIKKCSDSCCKYWIIFWQLFLSYSYIDMEKQITIESTFLYAFQLLTDPKYLEATSPDKDLPESVKQRVFCGYNLCSPVVSGALNIPLSTSKSSRWISTRFLNKFHSSRKRHWCHWEELLLLMLHSFLWSTDGTSLISLQLAWIEVT